MPPQIVCPEKHPSNNDDHQCINMLKKDGQFFEDISPAHPFNDQKEHIIQSPDDKIPACTMPDSCKKKYNKQIEIYSAGRAFAATHRYIYIIPEPC